MSHHKPSSGLKRFLYSIFSFYTNKGMHKDAAKGRMYDETLEAVLEMAKADPDIPDHALVLSAQHLSRHLFARGKQLTEQKLKTAIEAEDVQTVEQIRPQIA